MSRDSVSIPIRVHQVPCPYCRCGLDGAAALGPDAETKGKELAPSPGDITVCSSCINWLIFQEDGSLRPISTEEIAAIDNETFERICKVSRVLSEIKKGKRPPLSRGRFE